MSFTPNCRTGLSHAALVLALAAAGSAQERGAQDWGVEELRSRTPGFQSESLVARLSQVGELLAAGELARGAIAAAIHGDHREYKLKVERFLDQLADERWLAREDAERTLIQVGGRALQQIEERAKSGQTYEERVRAERILLAITAAGTEEAQKELRFLRGLVVSAAYLPRYEHLERALVSALAHTDSLIVEGALRALGRVGGPDTTAMLAARIERESPGSGTRRAALAGLGELGHESALDLAQRLLVTPGALKPGEAVGLLRDLALRSDATALRARLAVPETGAHEAVRALAAMRVPDSTEPAPKVRALLSGREELQGELVSVGGGSVRLAAAIPGLPVVDCSLSDCEAIEFGRPIVVDPGAARVFLIQGTLLAGALLALDAEHVVVKDATFGEVRLRRNEVQGIALDPALDRLVGASMEVDRLRMRDGSMRDGELRVLGPDGLVFVQKGGAEERIAQKDVAGVLLRRPATPFSDDDVYAHIDLVDGERLFAHVGVLRSDVLGAYVPGIGAALIPLTRVARIEFGVAAGAQWGFTLIAEFSENRIVEFDEQGNELFTLRDVYGAWDCECLENGNLLVTEYALDRVVEVTRTGEEVWLFDELTNPYDADRLANGNTLIADTVGNRVVEVDPAKKIVWKLEDVRPYDAERLANGNTLVCDQRSKHERVVEVDRNGAVVWEYPTPNSPFDADRLANGNTLITERTKHRVIEVDRSGNIVFQIDNLNAPSDADRLPNGHTIVAENGTVREFDRQGRQCWARAVGWAVEVNRY
ncbi:MAG: hypothetical protein IT457_04905 [Planctomycetes bacterium]|nr:hypothetical protein [Planctomycetota bacterium]